MKLLKYLSFIYILISSLCNNCAKAQDKIRQKNDSIFSFDDHNVIYPLISNSDRKDKMHAENKYTFQIENLKKADALLEESNLVTVFENVIEEELHKFGRNLREDIQVNYNIKAIYIGPDSLVSFGHRSFFWGMYHAYADHRPVVFSPDMIWLLIMQGLTNHVNNNPEELRSLFVDLDNKANLIVHYSPKNNIITWEDMFLEFPNQIAHFTGDELINTLTSDFTTTSPTDRTISQLSIMAIAEPYFNYWGAISVCGITEVTLEGKPADWEKLLEKAQYIRKYKLDWWIDELEPILKEFVNASQGNVNKEFWQNMIKIRKGEMCGNPDFIDGWIVKFFPFFSNGNSTGLEKISVTDKLASEVFKIDLNYFFTDGIIKKVIPLEIWAGFIGLRQDKKTLALKPESGWLIRKKDESNLPLSYFFENEDYGKNYFFTVNKIPDELIQLGEADYLTIKFRGKIDIPDKMTQMKIKSLELYGTIADEETNRICKMFPDTKITINDKEYQSEK